MKTLSIFGATGKTGLHILSQAITQNYSVHAFTRSPEKLFPDSKIRVYQGDIFNPDQLIDGIKGTDAVLIALGANPMDPNKVRAKATTAIVDAMKKTELQRVICLSTLGAGDSIKIMPKSTQMIFKMFLGAALKDHEAQESVLENSDLDWTIVRPARLTDGPLTQNYQVDIQEGQPFQSQISRADVADFMLKEVKDQKFIQKKVVISY